GGMDDLDDAKFIERIKTIHVAHADTDAGATVEAKTIEAPFEGTQTTIDMLIKRLYDDFQAFNSAAVTASNQTATAIQASYVPLDLKTDKIERQVTRFITGILRLAGIDDKPTYTRNQMINRQEETQTLIQQAPWLDDEYLLKKLLTINGDIDMYAEIAERVDAENEARLAEAEARQKKENDAEEEADA
ncbi:MAG: phage portal protein, partial [Oscillospiraceae bacterium]|nr:phage portal protein [Oscillospiraceae bacterium]